MHVNYTTIPRPILLRMKNISDNTSREIKTHILSSITFSLKKSGKITLGRPITDDNQEHGYYMLDK